MQLLWVLVPIMGAGLTIILLALRRSARRPPTPAELGDLLADASAKVPPPKRGERAA